jgi:hypothetical protein
MRQSQALVPEGTRPDADTELHKETQHEEFASWFLVERIPGNEGTAIIAPVVYSVDVILSCDSGVQDRYLQYHRVVARSR